MREIDYVDKKEDKWIAAMQNMPLVYGESMLGSEEWMEYRSQVEDSVRRAEQGESGGVDEVMYELE